MGVHMCFPVRRELKLLTVGTWRGGRRGVHMSFPVRRELKRSAFYRESWR